MKVARSRLLAPGHSLLGALSIHPKIPEISARNQIVRAISIRSDRNTWDHILKVVHFDRSGHLLNRSVGPTCPFPFDKIVVPSTALLYPAYKNNNQPRRGNET